MEQREERRGQVKRKRSGEGRGREGHSYDGRLLGCGYTSLSPQTEANGNRRGGGRRER
jgi:hypothetical protein